MAHPFEEGAAFLLEAVFVMLGILTVACRASRLVAAAGAFDAQRYLGVHQDGELGLEIAAQNTVQGQHRLAAQFAAPALVGLGGIGEAIAEQDAAVGQGGLDHFLDVLGAGGEHES